MAWNHAPGNDGVESFELAEMLYEYSYFLDGAANLARVLKLPHDAIERRSQRARMFANRLHALDRQILPKE